MLLFCFQLGASLVRQGDLPHAVESFENAFNITKGSNNFDLAAIASANLSVVFCKTKRFKESVSACKQAMELTAKLNSTTCFEVIVIPFHFPLVISCSLSIFNTLEH
jgi:tetratricopeptide (TPR) repeat protein